MSQLSIGALKAEVARLHNECARLTKDLDEASEIVSARERMHDHFVNAILEHAPECWGTGSGDETAIDYVRSLEGEGGGMTGHNEECGCWS